ncbi:MAG TPA: bifunctional nuclease family protein [Planktothrix sp.]|jgi:hypothetical protein
MRVDSIQLDPRSLQPIMVLCDDAKMRALPIWIGSAEANAIARILMSVESPRPKTHQLMMTMVSKLGATIKQIEINELEDDTFFATIQLERTGANGEKETLSLDARPSDAVALALIADVAIYVAPAVVMESTYPVDSERDEAEAEEFKKFLNNITATDFTKHAALPAEEKTQEDGSIAREDRKSDAA